MPTDDPRLAGFTKSGSPRLWTTEPHTRPGFASKSRLRTATHGSTGSPAAASRRLATSLSICSAEPSTPEPT